MEIGAAVSGPSRSGGDPPDHKQAEDGLNKKIGLLDLPPELLDEIFKRLDYLSLNNIVMVCRYLKNHRNRFIGTYNTLYREKEEEYFAGDYATRGDYYDDFEDRDMHWSYSRGDYHNDSTPSNSNYDPEEDYWFDLD